MQIGDSYEVSTIVTYEMTAEALGSGGMKVFGTPYLAAMMEAAAFTLMNQSLPEGKSSVGTKLNVEHTSPTPIGMTVTAKAVITNISANGKMVDFQCSVRDETGPIGGGEHQRAIVDLERFLAKCNKKLEEVAS